MLGGIQPEALRQVASASIDDGLMARLLPIMIRGATGGQDKRNLPTEYEALIKRLHRMPDDYTLEFADGAFAIREDLERKHLELMALESVNKKLASHIGKYNGIFVRLCIIWHCIEEPTEGYVSKDIAQRVADFMHKFLLPHAVAFYVGLLGLSDDHDRLKAIAGFILARHLDKITNRDVQRGDRTMRGLTKPDIERIFHQLDALGWLICDPDSPPNKPQWGINPVVHVEFAKRAKQESDRRKRDHEMIVDLLKKPSRDNGDKNTNIS